MTSPRGGSFDLTLACLSCLRPSRGPGGSTLLTGQGGGGAASTGSKPRSRKVPGGRTGTGSEVCALPSRPVWPRASPLGSASSSRTPRARSSLSSAAIWCRSPGEDAARQGSGAILLGPSCSLCSGLSLTGLWSPRVAAKCGMIVPGPLWWRGSQRKVSPLMRWVAFQRLDAFRRRLSRWFSKCVEGRSSVLTFLGAGGVGQSVARTCVSVPLALESVPPAGGEGSGAGVREPWAAAGSSSECSRRRACPSS